MNTILLRFRDIKDGIDTIKEHSKLIDDKGFVWWGWWKKSKEENKIDAIHTFQKSIKTGNKIKIGIFDRDAGQFYSAELIDIKSNFKLKFESPDKSLTPNYYKDEKLYCWLKLCTIDKISKEEFVKQFSIVPTIEDTLYALPYDENSILRKEIECGNILHLSDLHFGADFGFKSRSSGTQINLLDRIKDYFNLTNKIKIGLVIVSGDVTSRGDIGVLQGPALEFLTKLCELLNIRKDQLIIVPGNHDIPLEDPNLYDFNHENGYKFFLKELYGERKEMYGYEKYITKDGLKIDILRINSIKLRSLAEKNYGYVGWNNYKYLIDENIETDSSIIRIAVLHHHLISMSTEEQLGSDPLYGNVSVTLDAGKVIEGLQHYNFDLVLHGHQHVPGINKVHRGVRNGTTVNLERGLFLSGAGSAGAKVERLNGEFRDNSFTVIKLKDKKINFETVQYNSNREPTKYFDFEIEKK